MNGLAIYREDDPSEEVEAFMVSCVVRSTPTACFRALMVGNKDNGMPSMGFLNMDVLDKLDDRADLVSTRLLLNGWWSSLLAPREMLLARNWRKDEEDGTFTVMMKSTDRFVSEDMSGNAAAAAQLQETIGQWLWDPIRAQVCPSALYPFALTYSHLGPGGSFHHCSLAGQVLQSEFRIARGVADHGVED